MHYMPFVADSGVVPHAIECFLCKTPIVNLGPEREFAMLPVDDDSSMSLDC